LLDCREEAEGTRDKWDIAIDGLRDSDHGERVTPLLGLVEQGFRAALRAITADAEQNIAAAPDEIVHSTGGVRWAAGGAQNSAGRQMNPTHDLGREDERFGAPLRVQPLKSPAEAKHLSDAVRVMHLVKQRSDHIVQSGAESSAGHNAGASFRWIEEQPFA